MNEDKNIIPEISQGRGPGFNSEVEQKQALHELSTLRFKEFMADEANSVAVERIVMLLGKNNKKELEDQTVDQVSTQVQNEMLEAIQRTERNIEMGALLEARELIESVQTEHLNALSECIPGVLQAIDKVLEEPMIANSYEPKLHDQLQADQVSFEIPHQISSISNADISEIGRPDSTPYVATTQNQDRGL